MMINPQKLLICPETHRPLKLDWEKNIASVEGTHRTYPIKDGIIDFIPDVNDDVSAEFDAMASGYDDWMNSANKLQKLSTWITWGFMDDWRYANWLLARIPDDFDGVLLDVPCGTGILALEKYKKLERATIIALDYSLEMLRRGAQEFSESRPAECDPGARGRRRAARQGWSGGSLRVHQWLSYLPRQAESLG